MWIPTKTKSANVKKQPLLLQRLLFAFCALETQEKICYNKENSEESS